jgi:signal transduction histidine kinase
MGVFQKDSIEANSLGSINRQCDRIAGLIEDMIQASRQGNPGGVDEPKAIDIGQIATEVAERARHHSRKHAVVLSVEKGCIIRGDAARMGDAIENLVDNAIKFSPEGGEVKVIVSQLNETVQVAIEDRGIGIPKERQNRITERYYRAHADSPHDFGGMGIGLNLSKQIVIRHGGRLWFESAPGSGSKFAFEIPMVKAGGNVVG